MRGLRLLLSVALVATLVPTVAAAQTDELRDRLAEAEQERAVVGQELAEVREDERDARSRLATADAELATAQARLAEREAELAERRAELEAAQAALEEARARVAEAQAHRERVDAELEATLAELAAKQARLDARIRAAFKYGNVSFAEAFVGVRDFADFLNTTQYVSHVLENDRVLLAAVEELRRQVEIKQAEAVAAQVEADAAQAEADRLAAEAAAAAEDAGRLAAEAEAAAVEVRRRRAAQAAALEALREDRAALEGHLAGLEAESARIQAQLAEIARRLEEERRRAEEERLRREASEACEAAKATEDEDAIREACGHVPPTGDGTWVRPVNGRMSSPFGPRPSLGGYHYGVDLADAMGTTIVAARWGEVVWVTAGCHPTSSWTCGGGFGNYVVINHHDGYATVYAHQSSVSVSTGQYVGAGEKIGEVGNSGRSYGPHVHFELYENGARKNPCGFIAC